MIAIACPHCETKLKVKDEFAGKRVRCLSCKQSVDVPAATLVESARQPPANVAEEVTLPPPVSRPSEDVTLPPRLPANAMADKVRAQSLLKSREANGAADRVQAAASYSVAAEIARGGMGAVMRAIDEDIRREVAVKFLLNENDARHKARFIEEAQITGQLEHPNIVPIHQLGVGEDGRCFFAMKMVKGKSLSEILKKQGEPAARGEPGASATGGNLTLARLLNIFVNICNAMAYAHARGVIHRDLKPANVMVGDFGEVYVMDWGLAKVLDQKSEVGDQRSEIREQRSGVLGGQKSGTFSRDPKGSAADTENPSAKVQTNRPLDSDLTQDGAVMGTPAYMPPEQARGDTAATDQRSDIYSLGAILYEMLTLTPPVGRGGDALAMLMRVVEGQIEAPAKRAPERARKGLIPPELSAIALKALAKERDNRYQTVEELKLDIELYLDGRSVSAKQDSAFEVVKKFVKRNKGLSAGLALTLLVLLAGLIVVFAAWRETSAAYAAFEKEQEEKEKRTREAVPAFLEAARQALAQKQPDNALSQVSVALDYDPANAAALLLKGQLLVSRKEFAAAAKVLDRYVKLRPDDGHAAKLAQLCAVPDTDAPDVHEAMGNLLVLQKQASLAIGLFEGNEKRVAVYRKQLEAAWPGLGGLLSLDKDHKLVFTGTGNGWIKVRDRELTPLQGIPFSSMRLENLKVRDLGPLRGMPLASLKLFTFVNLKDLTPLRDLPLTSLEIRVCSALEIWRRFRDCV